MAHSAKLFIKLPERKKNLICPILHYYLSFVIVEARDWLPVGQVPTPDPISYGQSSQVGWPPMHEELPRTIAERNGVMPGCFLLKRWVRLEISTKDLYQDLISFRVKPVLLLSYLNNVLTLFLKKKERKKT